MGEAFATEYAFKLDDEILNGTGADQCLGILSANNGSLVSQAKETGQEGGLRGHGEYHEYVVAHAVEVSPQCRVADQPGNRTEA